MQTLSELERPETTKFPIFLLSFFELILLCVFSWGNLVGFKLFIIKLMMVGILILIAFLIGRNQESEREPTVRELVQHSHRVRKLSGAIPSGMPLREVFLSILQSSYFTFFESSYFLKFESYFLNSIASLI